MSVGEVDPDTKWEEQDLDRGNEFDSAGLDPYVIPPYAEHPAADLGNIVLGEE